jgi:hypothetical protein
VSTDPKTFGQYIAREYSKWGEVAKAIKLRIN